LTRAGAGILAVACSGGRDSIALLHAALRAARPLGLRVVALHVHHGLQPAADDWAARLEARCARWAAEGWPVSFACTRLAGGPAPGDSIEAWARRERYAALAQMARAAGATLVLLAHHRRDQAETVLLQALRGAGAAGLAAMPRLVVRDGVTWARPWLAQPAEAIGAYVAAAGLDFIVDPSNADPRHARSRLRTSVMPTLRAAFPEAETALAAVARQAHEARTALDELALEDLGALGAAQADELALAPWRALAPARRANALRAWLALRLGRAVPDTLLRRLLDETHDDAPRRWPVDAARTLHSWRGRLAVVAAPSAVVRADAAATAVAGAASLPAGGVALRLLRCGAHRVPGWPGALEVFAIAEHGVAPLRLAHAVARARAGAEQFQAQPRGTARSLKKQYQAAGLPVEARGGPLVFDQEGALLFVPGLGVDARAWAPAGAPQWGLRWIGEGA
jgi:tRNA(Ile)-lysidine synthase